MNPHFTPNQTSSKGQITFPCSHFTHKMPDILGKCKRTSRLYGQSLHKQFHNSPPSPPPFPRLRLSSALDQSPTPWETVIVLSVKFIVKPNWPSDRRGQRWNLILISYDVIKHQTNQTSALTPTTSTLASTLLTSSEPSSSLTVPCVASRRRPWASNKHHHLTSVLQKNQWSCSRRHCFITSTYPGSIFICATASERAFTQGFSNLTKWIIFHWNIERTTLTEESLLIGQKVIG